MSTFWMVVTAVFGAGGVLARFGMDRLLAASGAGFPWATFGVNLAGSLLAGAVAGWSGFSTEWRQAVLVGLLGGFTTFSAFSLQTFRMIEGGLWVEALLYATLSPALGVALAALGWKLSG